ncbi:cytochrome c peroxidase [Paludisphaera borealis]|uniref:Cytochrome c domain-containing protein n=1 Tax=Paludisphaera borealis TaxID=1387353 RepID=A0A1U7CSJ0_9BACT|nr:cytochrome c peroxidase [Paludisphaera borealis]APW61902.1 hypothetical protein BSF38_03432 [Paludisphaera borealis]
MTFRGMWTFGLAVCVMVPTLTFGAEARLRKPEALILVDGGTRLLTANRGAGTISIVDVESRRVAAEVNVGRGLADLKELPGGRWLLAVDQAAGELVLVERQGDVIRRASATPVASDPARVVVGADGLRAVVVSRWSRTLTFLAWDRPASPEVPPAVRVVSTLALPFSPLDAAAVPGGSPSLLVVADAFGGRLALIDQDAPAIVSDWNLPGHNLRSLRFSPDGRTLALLGQFVNPVNRTTFDDIHWGFLAHSEMQTFRLDDLLTPGVDVETLLENGRAATIGNVGSGSADPSSFAFGPGGVLVVALAGTDEVATALGLGRPYKRQSVGRRPSALALSLDGRTAYTADALDDAISIVDLADRKVAAPIVLGTRPEPTLVEEGERLFTSARIGREGWMSCHTCHTDGHTAGVLVDTMTDGSYGAAKQTPTLLGVDRTGPWTWLGRIDRLEDQVRKSITTTLRGADPTDRQVDALTAYLRTLEPPKPVVATAPAEAVARGRAVFASHDCASCHAAPEYTTPKTYDVGLTDAVGSRAFNPPSLRGASRRATFLHDASARSLPDVFQSIQHPAGTVLTPAEIADLVAFLESL